MKVLHVLGELKPSGAEVMLKCGAKYWSTHNVDSDILSTGTVEGNYADTLRSVGYRVIHVARSRSPLFLVKLIHLYVKGRYDVIHVHADPMSFWVALVALLANKKVVRTFHSQFKFEGFLRWRRKFQRRLLQLLGVEFVAIGDAVRSNEQNRFGLRTSLILNWVDLDVFRPPTHQERLAARAELGLSNDRFVLITVGNCSDIKNHQVLLRALSLVHQPAAITYLHVGMEDEAHSERSYCEQLSLECDVQYFGPSSNVSKQLAAADLFVMPSKYEGLGNAALEALAMGLPAILNDVDGLRELGKYFSSVSFFNGTPDSLAREIQESMALNRSEAICGEAVRHTFSAACGIGNYVGLYIRLIGRVS